MQNFPLVSVICLCYNHSKYVEKTLNSVITQTYPNIELIIIDDFSTDDSVNVIEKWIEKHLDIRFIVNSKNIGNTKTFNNAAKFASGNYIIDLAADDVLLSNCIEEQINTFLNSKYPNLGIVYGNIELIDEKDNFLSIYYNEKDHPESGDIYKMVISRSTKICSVASMVKKEVYENIGYYDENLAYEDLDLWVRTSRRYQFEYIPKILVQKRELTNSLSSYFTKKNNNKTRQIHESSFKILEKAYTLNKSKEEYKALLGRIKFELFKTIYSRNFYITFKHLFLGIKSFIKSI